MNSRESDSQKKGWYIGLLILVAALAAAAYSYTVVVKVTKVDPAKVFEENFQNSISDVTDLTGGGELSGYFNVWIKFKYHGQKLTLKDSNDYGDKLPMEAIRWFIDMYPDDSALKSDQTDYQLKGRTVSSPQHVKNEWLLTNVKTHDYYFRYWGE